MALPVICKLKIWPPDEALFIVSKQRLQLCSVALGISCKFDHHWLQNWWSGDSSCASYKFVRHMSWYLFQPESHQLSLHIVSKSLTEWHSVTSGPKERNPGLLGSDKNTITDGGINATHLKAISGRIKRIGSCLKRKLVFQDHLAVLEMLCGTCSLSVDSLRGDTAAGSLRVWLFIYQDQGWTLPDLVCPSTTLLRLLHYLPLHYLFARALHY